MDYKFEVIETAEQSVLSQSTVTAVENLPQELGKAYNSIIEYLKELGKEAIDAPFAAYYNMDMEKLDVEMGFLVEKGLEGRGEINANIIPAGKKATCMYKGAYKDMVPAYEAMTKWINENGYKPTGIVYEHYYNSPMDVPENELLTKIVFLLED
jgi:effector-binding domain-containing protein